MTLQTQLVLGVLLADPAATRYGLELCGATGLASGTVYPILARLERVGWVRGDWEDPLVHEEEGRPRRRLYRLTDEGATSARNAVSRARQRAGTPAWQFPDLGVAGGRS